MVHFTLLLFTQYGSLILLAVHYGWLTLAPCCSEDTVRSKHMLVIRPDSLVVDAILELWFARIP